MMSASVQEAVLDAAERLIGRHGFQKVTMQDIAWEAGVGRRTIYLHFESKEDVALRSVDRMADRVLDALRVIAASDGPAPSRLRDMLVARVMVRFDAASAYHAGLDALFDRLRPAYQERRRRHVDAEARVFARTLGHRAFAVDSGLATAHDLLLATSALLPHSLGTRELGERPAVARRARRLADILVRGVCRTRGREGGGGRLRSAKSRRP